jgi:hypothetical protein
MKESEIIFLATKAFDKGWDYETLSYGDDLYRFKDEEKEDLLEKIWEYVEEIESYGTIAFKEKYKGYKLYI